MNGWPSLFLKTKKCLKFLLQAALGIKLMQNQPIKVMRKDVLLAKCYGGDIQKKLLRKNKKKVRRR